MEMYFLTSNRDKLREVQAMLPAIQGIDLDLMEIQELDATKIIQAKLAEARKSHTGRFLVEDTSLAIDEMHGLPGPFVKWFLQAIGLQGIYDLTTVVGSARATARTLIGYADEQGGISFFEGRLHGLLVPPRGTQGFGWDALFQPDGSTHTLAEMTMAEKNQFSMRRLAIEQLRHHLAR